MSREKDGSYGLFTEYFLKGMAGEGDEEPHGDGNGKVSSKELKYHLDDAITYLAHWYYGRTQKAQIVINDQGLSVSNWRKSYPDSPSHTFSDKLPPMRILTAALCLTVAVLFESMGVSVSADIQRGWDALKRGDYAIALREWEPLAKQGIAVAQNNLGTMYYNGEGIPKNDKEAVKWYRLSAEQGHASAQYYLGQLYDEGRGVPQNDKTAVKWWTLAAEQGDAIDQIELGRMYRYGQGVIQDPVYAHMWFNIAASSGIKIAFESRDILAKRMIPADISAAQKLARECVRKNYKEC